MEMQSPNLTIMPMEVIDLQWFVEVAAMRMLRDELKRPEFFNRENIFKLASKALEEGTAFVVKHNGECVGALGAMYVPNLFNPGIHCLAEVFWYVLPEYRESKAGSMLLKAFDYLGESEGIESTLSLLPTSAYGVEKLEKIGYNLVEFGFRKVR